MIPTGVINQTVRENLFFLSYIVLVVIYLNVCDYETSSFTFKLMEYKLWLTISGSPVDLK